MKKMKLLPLLGAALLALTGCGSSGGEITRKEARKLYNPNDIGGYNVYLDTRACSFDYGVGPEVLRLKEGTSIEGVTNSVISSGIYEKLYLFHENPIIASDVTFFNNVDDECAYVLADMFEEKPTYTVDGKKATISFTGSTQMKLNEKNYGFAMYFEAKFSKKGFVTKSSFELVVATDLKDKSAETMLRYTGSIKTIIQEVH